MLKVFKRLLEDRRLAVILAIGAVLVMLPALNTGLGLDDLPQRAVELRPDQLPARMQETGTPANSGSFSTVLFDLFGLDRNPQCKALMKNYGTLPWWSPDDLKCSVWRPAAAFTHWLDYRLFPNSPALMHAHSIAWFAAVVFLVTVVYRKLMGTGWAAGLAAILFLLDGDIYFPVAYVANRGFILALFFGLLCLYEHHQWRSTKSRWGLVLSALFLMLSLLSEEGGASTFAFILAYALVLEQGSLRERALTVLPSVLVIIAWRMIYTFSGYGLNHIGMYIDPAHEPLHYLRELIPRDMVILGSQVSGVPPELLFVVRPSLHPMIIAIYGALTVVALAVFVPWVRRDRMAAFWLAVMILAAIPEAVLWPIAKNFGFIAVGAFGLIGSFVAGVVDGTVRLPEWRTYRPLAVTACVVLMLAHVPGAIAKRIIVARWTHFNSDLVKGLAVFGDVADVENKDVVVVNAPSPLLLFYVPSHKVYYHRALSRSLRSLVPGCTSLDVQRTDDRTLVIQSGGPNIFSCDDAGPVHPAYGLSTFTLVAGERQCKKGDCYDVGGVTVEVLETDAEGLPARVAFHFGAALGSGNYRWYWFDWDTIRVKAFEVPAVGESVTLAGPRGR